MKYPITLDQLREKMDLNDRQISLMLGMSNSSILKKTFEDPSKMRIITLKHVAAATGSVVTIGSGKKFCKLEDLGQEALLCSKLFWLSKETGHQIGVIKNALRPNSFKVGCTVIEKIANALDMTIEIYPSGIVKERPVKQKKQNKEVA